jgi:carbamoyltransferase
MNILGIKLTHDAAVAFVSDGELIFSTELEKVGNNPRYTKMPAWGAILDVLESEGLKPSHIDHFVIDGWKVGNANWPGGPTCVAPYHEGDGRRLDYPLQPTELPFRDPAPFPGSYVSFSHVMGHIVGSYVTSPYAASKQPAYVLVWDGGTGARLYFVDPNHYDPWEKVTFVKEITCIFGYIYSMMGYYFGPYRDWGMCGAAMNPSLLRDNVFGTYEWPGKLMAWIGDARRDAQLQDIFRGYLYSMDRALTEVPEWGAVRRRQGGVHEHEILRAFQRVCSMLSVPDDVALVTIQHELGQHLLRGLEDAIYAHSKSLSTPLIFTGGSALNIKWNAMLRNSGMFPDVWVPPFPNDSGSALGAAACMMAYEGDWSLKWSHYAGPKLILEDNDRHAMWTSSLMEPEHLGRWLQGNRLSAVIAMHGRAELGPRALGHRSILMSAEMDSNKSYLNGVKGREGFRPVAPICMEEHAPEFFAPGTPDPYMLFEHMVRKERVKKVPAIVHSDGSARLQTVNESQCPITYRILQGHVEAGGPPLLCNTSANFPGKGFLPSVEDALAFAAQTSIAAVWAEGRFYVRQR